MRVAVFVLVTCFVLLSCNSDYIPKPRGYFKIDLPERQYRVFDEPGFPYTFEYPVYATIERDSSFFGETPENPWWININFPKLNGRIYVSYNIIGGRAIYKIKEADGTYRDSLSTNSLANLTDGSYKLTYKHSVKASSIEDSLIQTANGVNGVYFRVGGNAATANQFFLTDSVKHFFRGALYFDTAPNEDSLRPVNEFLKKDMLHLINTFEWRR
jgi:gliding motility-associated lipoprotein GldD